MVNPQRMKNYLSLSSTGIAVAFLLRAIRRLRRGMGRERQPRGKKNGAEQFKPRRKKARLFFTSTKGSKAASMTFKRGFPKSKSWWLPDDRANW